MKTRVESHVDSCRVTLDTKYDQITIPWQPQPHFSEIIHPMVKIRDFKSRFLMSWCDSEHQTCEIKYFYIRDSNFGKVSMICLHLSSPFVIDRLRVVLVQPPVIWSLHHLGPQNRSRGLQTTFETSLCTYSSTRTVWTHQIQNIHDRLV